MSASPARAAAFARLARHAADYPEFAFGDDAPAGLEPRDAALARAIEQSTLRHWRAIVPVLSACVTRRFDEVQPEVRGVLMGSAAQLLMHDRLPDHAVVDDAVEWTKEHVHPRPAAFVNAVLRKVIALRGGLLEATDPDAARWRERRDALPLSDGRVRLLTDALLPESQVQRLSAQCSIGRALFEHWTSTKGFEPAVTLAVQSLVQPGLTVTGIPAGAVDPSTKAAWPMTQHDLAGFMVWEGGHDALMAALRAYPEARVQDPASARAVDATRHLQPRRILDACAGRGTKTAQLASAHPAAEIIATDVDGPRRAALRQRFKGHARVNIVGPEQLASFGAGFDLILLDVPCSNTGVLCRRVEAKYRFSTKGLAGLVELQQGIALDHAPLLAREGRMLWSTCSLEHAENRSQAEWLSRRLKLRIEHDEATAPAGVPGSPATSVRNGSYHALLGP
ncbi:MAG: transcription antitermination factor NusB [Bacteroidia bacterium]|nr:transcription antitermination factor NusB [Bacteroidia bacterium]